LKYPAAMAAVFPHRRHMGAPANPFVADKGNLGTAIIGCY